MKTFFQTAAAIALTTAAATTAYADNGQLAASAGLNATETASLTLNEIAFVKFNEDGRGDDRQAYVTPAAKANPAARSQLIAATGMTPAEAGQLSLIELAVAKSSREARGDDRYVVVSSRGMSSGGVSHAQLIASVGISPEVAQSMSLHEIYLVKIARESSDNN